MGEILLGLGLINSRVFGICIYHGVDSVLGVRMRVFE